MSWVGGGLRELGVDSGGWLGGEGRCLSPTHTLDPAGRVPDGAGRSQPKLGGLGIGHQAMGAPHVESWMAVCPVGKEGSHCPLALLGYVVPGDVRSPRVGAKVAPGQRAANPRLLLAR